ncbi:Carboxypeptidase B, partial [Saguinus oedipus]
LSFANPCAKEVHKLHVYQTTLQSISTIYEYLHNLTRATGLSLNEKDNKGDSHHHAACSAVRTYGREIHMTELLDKLDFYVLPVVNVDGYIYTWTKNRLWRKTRSTHAGSSCFGTDLNRNFDAGWCKIGASQNPCDETYCGSAAESEKETKALADFIRKNLSSIKAYLTIHSYSQMMLYPYSYDYKLGTNNVELSTRQDNEILNSVNSLLSEKLKLGEKPLKPSHVAALIGTREPADPPVHSIASASKIEQLFPKDVNNALAKAAVKELATLHGTKYTYGPGATTIYPAAGGSDDWAYDQGIRYSFTFELRDRGRYGFLLPESQIRATCEETMLAIKHVASYVLEHMY